MVAPNCAGRPPSTQVERNYSTQRGSGFSLEMGARTLELIDKTTDTLDYYCEWHKTNINNNKYKLNTQTNDSTTPTRIIIINNDR